MLNPDPRKLRFLGIDLRSRFRRRCAVVLMFGSYLLLVILVATGMEQSPILQRYHLGIWLMLAVLSLFSMGIFREGGPVKAFHEPVWKLRGFKGGAVMIRSLDDLAEYRFGAKLDALPPAEQSEVLRSYRVGNYLFSADTSRAPSRLDERERIEKDRAYSATLASLTRYLFIMAGVYGMRKGAISPAEVAATLFFLAYIGLNGPKAAILWNETVSPQGELHLAGGDAS